MKPSILPPSISACAESALCCAPRSPEPGRDRGSRSCRLEDRARNAEMAVSRGEPVGAGEGAEVRVEGAVLLHHDDHVPDAMDPVPAVPQQSDGGRRRSAGSVTPAPAQPASVVSARTKARPGERESALTLAHPPTIDPIPKDRLGDRAGSGDRPGEDREDLANCELLRIRVFHSARDGDSFAADGTLRARSTRSRVGGMVPRKSWRQVESSFPAPSFSRKA